MKKIYAILVILVFAVIAMAYLYFTSLNKESKQNEYGLNVLSMHSSLLIHFDNDKSFYDILAGQTITDNLLGQQKTVWLNALNNTLQANSSLNKTLAGRKIGMGFSPTQKNHIAILITIQLDESIIPVIQSKLKRSTQGLPDEINKLTLSNHQTAYYFLRHSTLILSNEETTLRQINNTENSKNEFSKYIQREEKFTSNALARIYVNYQTLPSLLEKMLQNKLSGELQIFNNQKSFASFNYNFSNEKLLLSGDTKIENDQNYLHLFIDQAEQKSSLDLILPKQTANYQLYQIADMEKWTSALASWQKTNPFYGSKQSALQAIADKYRLDINETIPKYFNKQWITFQLINGDKLGLIAIKNGDKLAQSLLDLSTSYNGDVRMLKERNLLSYFLGQPFEKFVRPFYAIIDNYLIVSNYPTSVQNFINSYRNNEFLSDTDSYREFRNQISDRVTVSFFINNRNSKQLMGKNLKKPYYDQYIRDTGLSDYNCFAYQLSGDIDKFMTDVLLLKRREDKTVDRIAIDSLIQKRHQPIKTKKAV